MGCFNLVEKLRVRNKEKKRQKSRKQIQDDHTRRLRETLSLNNAICAAIKLFAIKDKVTDVDNSAPASASQNNTSNSDRQDSEFQNCIEQIQHWNGDRRHNSSDSRHDRRGMGTTQNRCHNKAKKTLKRLFCIRSESETDSRSRSGDRQRRRPRHPLNRQERGVLRERLQQEAEQRHRQLEQHLEEWMHHIGGWDNFNNFIRDLEMETGDREEDERRRGLRTALINAIRDVTRGPQQIQLDGDEESRPRHWCLDLLDILIGAISLIVILAVFL